MVLYLGVVWIGCGKIVFGIDFWECCFYCWDIFVVIVEKIDFFKVVVSERGYLVCKCCDYCGWV